MISNIDSIICRRTETLADFRHAKSKPKVSMSFHVPFVLLRKKIKVKSWEKISEKTTWTTLGGSIRDNFAKNKTTFSGFAVNSVTSQTPVFFSFDNMLSGFARF